MNNLFLMLGIESWKPVLSSLLLPPVPLLLLALIGTRTLFWRRAVGWTLLMLAIAGLWLTACSATGEWLQRALLAPPPPLSMDSIAGLRREMASKSSVAVVVLGAGREANAPEYGVASLNPSSLERLRFGIWLGRQTNAPLMFSGGLGHAAQPGAAEADVAADIAVREFGRPLRWIENRSRDTRENAQFAVTELRDSKVERLVLVTHGWHMPRALRAFREASAQAGMRWEIVAAPMGLARSVERPTLRWLPSSEGYMTVRAALREKVGLLLGA